MTLDDLPHPIKEMILNDCNFDTYEPMPNSYSITEILGCLRQKYFQKTLPKRPVTLETAINFYRGKLWDGKFSPLFKRNQIRSTYTCRNVPVMISGKFDFFYDGAIYDLKCPANLFYVKNSGKASEGYRKQVLFYCFSNAIKKGFVLYWDGHECLKYPVEVTDETCKELIEEIEGRTVILWTSLHNGHAPNKNLYPPEDWMCRCCEFSTDCKGEK